MRLVPWRGRSRCGSEWIDALATDELPSDHVIDVVVASRDIVIYSVGEAIYAADDTCTHGQARLCDGFLDGHEIECPLHQSEFEVHDGSPTCAPVTAALRSYAVRVDGRRVSLRID